MIHKIPSLGLKSIADVTIFMALFRDIIWVSKCFWLGANKIHIVMSRGKGMNSTNENTAIEPHLESSLDTFLSVFVFLQARSEATSLDNETGFIIPPSQALPSYFLFTIGTRYRGRSISTH